MLADLPHAVERAEHRGFLDGELTSRSGVHSCDFFREAPSGCRSYLMKHVIHGALFLVERALPEVSSPCAGKYADALMMLLTGGRNRP